MKRLLIFSVLCAFVLGGIAYATETRVLTMGDANGIVKDEANVMIYPSTVNYYPKLFVGEYQSGPEFSIVGGHFRFAEDSKPMVIGAYFSTEPPYWPSILSSLGLGTRPTDGETPPATLDNRRIIFLYGREISGTPFGFKFNYDQASEKYNYPAPAADQTERSIMRMGFMFGLSPSNFDLSAGISLTSWTDKDATGADLTKPSGNMRIDLNARRWWGPFGKWMLVPHAGFVMDQEGVEELTAGSVTNKTTDTDMMVDIGLGGNYDAAPDVMLVTDFGVGYDAQKRKVEPTGGTSTEVKTTTMVLPYFRLGIDAMIFRWMDFRAGVASKWLGEKEEPTADTEETRSWVNTDAYLGAGFHWSDLMIDAWIDPGFLTRGPNFVSGASGNLGWRISLIYWFE